MTALIPVAIGVAVIVIAHLVSLALLARRVRAQDHVEEQRRIALYKQQKATAKAVAQTDSATRKLVDQTRGAHEDARLLLERAEQHFSDPRVKRFLGEEVTGHGG